MFRRTTRIRWTLLFAALAVVAAACTGGASDGGAAPLPTDESGAEGVAAPTGSFAMFDGSTASFADYSGRPLVVNFWASWCPSCVAELSAAFVPAQDLLGDQVAFLGLNIQDDRDRALALVDQTGATFDLGEDPAGDLYVELGGLGMPFTVFITADGRIVETHNGPLTEGQLTEMISTVLLG